MLCVGVALVVACVVGAVLALGRGCGPLVMLHVRALFVGGGGGVLVKCPCGGSGAHPRCWVLGWW